MKLITLILKSAFVLLLLNSSVTVAYSDNYNMEKTYNIKDYGAIGDGHTLNTHAINQAIIACSKAGGGIVRVPQGNYLTGSIMMKSDVTFYLEQGARIIGSSDSRLYRSYKLTHQDPNEPINITVSDSATWCNAIILMDHVQNVTITGTGTVDGNWPIDSSGRHRGPHGILMGDCKNITISDITVTRSGDYNILALFVENLKITGVTIIAGFDGIHIRQGRNLLIKDCKIYSRDDAIAGGYWKHTVIEDCLINSSCNGIRLVLPATDLEIRNCQISGPGVFGHPRGTRMDPLVRRTLTGIILQPGAWGLGAGKLQNIYIHDIRLRDMETAFTFVLNEGNQGNDIFVKDVVATGINRIACSVEAWPDSSYFSHVRFKNISIAYTLNNEHLSQVNDFRRPKTESRPIPYWGFYVRNVKDIEFDHVKMDYTGEDKRPVMGFDHVDKVVLDKVSYRNASGVQALKYSTSTDMKIIDSGPFDQ